MKLKDYFNMKMNGAVVWPHLNLMSSGDHTPIAPQDIERGILRTVLLRKTVEYDTHLDIEVDYEDRTYSTAFLWDDKTLLKSLHEFLKENSGKSLKEIGNLEFPLDPLT